MSENTDDENEGKSGVATATRTKKKLQKKQAFHWAL